MTKLRALLLMLGIVGLLLAGGSLPHLHASGEFGMWNEDHDLSLMAALGTAGSPLDAMPVVALVLALVLTLMPGVDRLASAPLRLSAPRAPPLR